MDELQLSIPVEKFIPDAVEECGCRLVTTIMRDNTLRISMIPHAPDCELIQMSLDAARDMGKEIHIVNVGTA
jgi:hypothetical protein